MTKQKNASTNHALTVGEVAKRSGVAVSTIHFYESKGLISSSRSDGNQRRFPSVVLRHIAIIKAAQRTGIPLESIKDMFSNIPSDKVLTAAQWKKISSQWRVDLDERIRKLTQLRNELDHCIGCGCLSLKECPLRNPDDILGAKGPGAQILEGN